MYVTEHHLIVDAKEILILDSVVDMEGDKTRQPNAKQQIQVLTDVVCDNINCMFFIAGVSVESLPSAAS